ncbi:MAG: preprotein translocase subunit SecE [Clostridia bacterium]|nr:preprotein translocase subunit SecE [Clostridia bacterium]
MKKTEKETKEVETKAEKPVAKKKDKKKKPNIFVRMGRKIKEVFSELKKVNWPSFGKIVKSTGVVLVVVLIFIVVVTAIDSGLSALLKLLVGA